VMTLGDQLMQRLCAGNLDTSLVVRSEVVLDNQ